MTQPIAKWRTRTGVWRTTPGATLSVDVEAYAPPDEGSLITSVDFAVSVNGGAPVVQTVTLLTIRRPNYSDALSPIQGAAAGELAPFWGFGIVLDCDSYPVGSTISIAATVWTQAGTSRVVPDGPIVLYNDRGGADSRPNPRTFYVNNVTGSDANPGTVGSPKATMPAALNTGAALSPTRDVGGMRIVLQNSGTSYPWVGGSMGAWQTSGHWPLTIECEDGVVIDRFPSFTFFSATGNGPGSRCYVRWASSGASNCARMVGQNKPVTIGSGVEYWEWIDGLSAGSRFWSPGKTTVRYHEDTESGPAWPIISPAANYRRWKSCCRVEGCTDGFIDDTDDHDCVVRDFTTLAFGCGGYMGLPGGPSLGMTYNLLNCVVMNGRVNHPDQLGWCFTFAPAGRITATYDAPTQKLRLDATGILFCSRYGLPGSTWPQTLSTLGELIGSPKFRVEVSGWPGNNGKYEVDSAGPNGSGYGYVVLKGVPSGVSGACPSNAVVKTEQVSAFPFDPHGGLDHAFGSNAPGVLEFHDSIRSGVRQFDIINMQGVFIECKTDRVAFVNYAVAPREDLDTRTPWGSSCAASNSVVMNVSWNGSWDIDSAMTNCLIANNVLRQQGGSVGVPNNGQNGCLVTHNHFIGGSTRGASATSGPFFANDPGNPPYSFAPLAGHLGTALALMPMPAAWLWPGTLSGSRGVLRSVGTGDWSTGVAGGVNVTAAPITVDLQVVAPTVMLGPVVKTAEATSFTLATSGPVASVGGGVATPAASLLTTATAGPTAVLGPVATAPAAVVLTLHTAGPGVVVDAIATVPSAVVVVFDTVDPIVVLGPVARVPDVSTFVIDTKGPPIAVTPKHPPPQVILGPLPTTPAPSVLTFTVPIVLVVVTGGQPQPQAPATLRPASRRKLWLRSRPNRAPYRS